MARSKRPTRPSTAPKTAPTRAPLDPLTKEKDAIVKRLNERIASVVRHAGVNNEEVARWQSKLTRSGSKYISKEKTFDPAKVKTTKNVGRNRKETYQAISRSKKDLEKMNIEDLRRLEKQTRGWGAVKSEAKKRLKEQARAQTVINPFIPESEQPKIPDPTEEEIVSYIDKKEKVRQFIEGNSEAFYALIESTGWDDIRDHTTAEIYERIQGINMDNYQFEGTTGEIGAAYIARREAARERRRQLGI